MARVGPINRVRAAIAATILVAGSMLIVVPMALAGTGMSITPNIPQPTSSLTVGATGVSSRLSITNSSDDPNQVGVIRVTNATLTTALGVFSLSATGTGDATTVCTGSTWNVTHVDGATTTTWTFTPTTNVDLTSALGPTPANSNCKVNFTVNVLKVPSTNPTIYTAAVTGVWDPGQQDQLGAGGSGQGQTQINKATPTLTTTASGPVTVGATITDTAHLSGGVGTLTGTMAFQVYGPGDTTCATPLAPQPTGNTVTAAGNFTSGPFTTTAVGTYRWRAFFTDTDGNNNDVSTPCNDANESSTVGKATPTLTTTASGPVTVGATITDTAHLSGGVGTLTGTMAFQVYGPGDTTCATPLAPQPTGNTVTAAGNFTSGPFTTTAVGTYRWRAFFTDTDGNNNDVSTPCNDANESSTVGKATPTLTTTASGPVTVGATITDTAHLSGGVGTLTGTMAFQVYGPGDTTCATPLAPQPTGNTVTAAGNFTSGPFTTTAVGTYRWRAFFTDTDGNNNDVSTPCNDANESSTVGKATPTLTTTASGPVTVGATITDTAHLSGGVGTLTGTMAFQVYGPGDTTCATPLAPQPTGNTVTAAGNFTSGPFTTTAVGTYRWRAFFTDTDGNNNDVSTPCNDTNESSTVTEAPIVKVTKTANPVGPVTAGNPIGFNVTVANIGTVTAHGVTLSDPLPTTPAGIGTWTIATGPTASGTVTPLPTCSISSATLTCTAADLAVGASYTLRVTAPTTTSTNGTANNTATIHSTDGNCVTGNNDTARCTSTAHVTITPPAFTANLTPGYWKNHQAATTKLLPQILGGYHVTTFTDAKTILSGMGCGHDGALNCMAGMLLAAKLNLQQGGSTCILPVVAQADALLIANSYNGFMPYTLTPSDKALAMSLHDKLSAYNIDGIPTC